MIFKRILINNFGGLREKDIELTSGVNVLYGLKETEMNIVFIFVKSMFFGVPEEMQEKNGIYEKQELKLPGKNMVELYGFSTMEKITA
ncbi:MAG: hypothetical protein ACLTZM_23885 [Ruminococcus sp.]